MSYVYKVMTQDPVNASWEDDSFASGWTASYCGLIRDGDIAEITVNIGYSGGWIQKGGLNINAVTYKYCVVCVRGTDRFFVEVFDGAWKSVTNGHEVAPSDYEVKVYDLSGITTGTITDIRLGVGDSQLKVALYDFIGFFSHEPSFATDRVLSLSIRQKESDIDEFELTGTDDIGSGLTIGRHIWIWLKGTVDVGRKVFAGVIEEATPEDRNGQVYRVNGRCFGQKLLLRTKSKTFNLREVSLAARDFVEDLTETTAFQVETPTPTVNITKDYRAEYIMDGLKDLAKQAGSDWEVKLGMSHDLRFRSRASSNVPSLPMQITESAGHILRGVSKQSDGFRLFNKVTVIGGELSNFNNDPDSYTDEGDASSWVAVGGSAVIEDKSSIAYGKCSLKFVWTDYVNDMTARHDLGASGKDLGCFKYLRFHHKTDGTGIQKNPPATDFHFLARLKDTTGVTATTEYLAWGSVQPPENFTEVNLELSTFTMGSGFDWGHVRYIELECDSDRTGGGEGVRGNYWIDKLYFYTSNVTKTVTASSDFRHTREYVYRDEKLIDPDFVSEVANALLNILKDKENRYRVPVIGMPFVQVGCKANVVSPTHGLNGTYYIVEAEHRVTPRDGYITEMTLEKPRLSLETLLAETIERKIKLIERGRIT